MALARRPPRRTSSSATTSGPLPPTSGSTPSSTSRRCCRPAAALRWWCPTRCCSKAAPVRRSAASSCTRVQRANPAAPAPRPVLRAGRQGQRNLLRQQIGVRDAVDEKALEGIRRSVRQTAAGAAVSILFWSGREDSNFRPPAPHAGALPGCATPRPNRDYTVPLTRPDRAIAGFPPVPAARWQRPASAPRPVRSASSSARHAPRPAARPPRCRDGGGRR